MTDAEYRAKRQQEINDKNALFDKVATIQNRAMKTALMECPKELAGIRTPEDCLHCANENCFKAWKEQNELWPEKYETPVLAANTAATDGSRESSRVFAKSQKSQELKNSQVHSRDANGIGKESRSLFDLRAA